ncbi:hypothetical protein AAFF_G00434890 [Aldrovandia affinis]|uniref:Uncharacterized protein n=1 Tax=Aldrovandia affinis TaxID=143900 RepID=A0AAD7WIE6_9TELE|nr:hypothetical protein AAFF_G00434890 [Aldrovandia affinis]
MQTRDLTALLLKQLFSGSSRTLGKAGSTRDPVFFGPVRRGSLHAMRGLCPIPAKADGQLCQKALRNASAMCIASHPASPSGHTLADSNSQCEQSPERTPP